MLYNLWKAKTGWVKKKLEQGNPLINDLAFIR